MESRRKFLKASAAALTVAATRPIFGIQGANDRVRMAVIGCGNRAGRVFDSFARQSNVQWVAGAEVNKAKLDSWMTPARQTFKLDMVGDYRRILDRKDVDAVLIGTPDHWHSQQTIDAISAGKDVYVEKPASNTVPRLNAMLDAYRRASRSSRSGRSSAAGITSSKPRRSSTAACSATSPTSTSSSPGSYARPKEAEQPVPAGLDWDMWQGPAPKRPFKPSRLGFRAWYEYGGGLVADWGAHHVDVAHWFMNADTQVPIKTAATGAFLAVPDADPEQVPDTFSISWQYDKFLMTFANGEVPRAAGRSRRLGRVLRQPAARHAAGEPHGLGGAAAGAAHDPQAGAAAAADCRRHDPRRGAGRRGRARCDPAAPGGPGGGGGGRGRGGGRGGSESSAGRVQGLPESAAAASKRTIRSTRTSKNFLDCMKSRQKPNADMEIGYHAALPCLLALEALHQGKTLGWDAAARKSKAL